MHATKKIGITLGDPSGIGPEVVVSTLARLSAQQRKNTIIFGNNWLLARASRLLDVALPSDIQVVECGQLSAKSAVPGIPCLSGARAQVSYLETAVAWAKRNEVSAIVTAPVSKWQLQKADFGFLGHTDYLQSAFHSERAVMTFVGPCFRVSLVTAHIPLSCVTSRLEATDIAQVASKLAAYMQISLGYTIPRIGILGVNPHAGEQGELGHEDKQIVAQAVALAQTAGVDCYGPLVPDVAFRQAQSGQFDGLVAMYHDQALIPVKLVDFHRTVNVTLGLGITRTSPDHGVAYDIAGQGEADPTSFMHAYLLAELDIGRGTE